MPDRSTVPQIPWSYDLSRIPRDGTGFLAFGIHTNRPPDAARGVKPGDYWWSILLWDVWRPPSRFVFAKDGAPAWPGIVAWAPLTEPIELLGLADAEPARHDPAAAVPARFPAALVTEFVDMTSVSPAAADPFVTIRLTDYDASGLRGLLDREIDRLRRRLEMLPEDFAAPGASYLGQLQRVLDALAAGMAVGDARAPASAIVHNEETAP